MKKSNKDLSPGELAMQGHWVSDDEIIEAQRIERRIKKILKKSDIILSQEIGKDLWSAIDHFLYKRSHLKRYISNSEKKALMEDLEKSAYDFAHALENVKNPEIKRDLPMSQVKKSRTKIRELINISKAWGKAASQAKPTIKLGRPTMGDQTPFTEEFALQLAKFFEQATNKPATAGYWNVERNEICGNDFPLFFAEVLCAIDKNINFLKISGDPDDEELSENSRRNLQLFLSKALSKE